MFASLDVKDSILEPPPTGMLGSMEKSVRVEMLLKEAVREDGRYAIFIKLESDHPELKKSLDDYLLYIDSDESLRMTNCKTITRKWYIIGELNHNFKLEYSLLYAESWPGSTWWRGSSMSTTAAKAATSPSTSCSKANLCRTLPI